MFRPLILIIISLVFCHCAHAQKHDYVWIMGYESSEDTTNCFGGFDLDFNGDELQQKNRIGALDFDSMSASICDSFGNLLFYTNGCKILDYKDRVVPGGEQLTREDNFWTQDFFCPYGWTTLSSSMILDHPSNNGEYLLLNQDIVVDEVQFPYVVEVQFSFINANNRDSIYVADQFTHFFDDTTAIGSISANRHANGKDWWIFINQFNSNSIYRFLYNTDGVSLDGIQSIGEVLISETGLISNKFSPDGTLFTKFFIDFGLEIMDFDRETGLFSNAMHFPFWEEKDIAKVTGTVEFSANSQVLYINHALTLFQFDLSAQEIFDSRIIIDTFRIDTTDLFRANFNAMQLAPDGKIYMSCWNGSKKYHIIEEPNVIGKGCNF